MKKIFVFISLLLILLGYKSDLINLNFEDGTGGLILLKINLEGEHLHVPQEVNSFISAHENHWWPCNSSRRKNMSTQGDTWKLSLVAPIPALEADSPSEDRSSPAPSEHTHTHSELNLCNYSQCGWCGLSAMPFHQAGQPTPVNAEEPRSWAHAFFPFQDFHLHSVGSFFFPPWGKFLKKEIMQRCPWRLT